MFRGWIRMDVHFRIQENFRKHSYLQPAFVRSHPCQMHPAHATTELRKISLSVCNPLTGRPRSRGTASAARRLPAASHSPCAAWWCRGRSCPAGRRSLPRCTSGPPWGLPWGLGPSTWRTMICVECGGETTETRALTIDSSTSLRVQ